MKKPLISIVVPIYGVEKYLPQCVESILDQTYENLEIILVDDGSPDKCPEIIDGYAAQDKRIVPVHQKNGGYSSAVNHGLDIANGDYIGIVESDDWIEPNMYERLVMTALDTDADVVRAEYYNEFPDGTTESKWMGAIKSPKNTCTLAEFPQFLHFHPAVWSCLYKSNIIKDNNIRFYDAPGAAWTDNLFQVQTLWYAKSIACLREPLYHYRRRDHDGRSDIKNYHTPFDRTREIHTWMRSHNITDAGMWACLYKREISYMKQVCLVTKFSTVCGTLKEIKACIRDMDKDIIKESKYLTHDDRRVVKKFQSRPILYLLKYKRIRLFHK